MISNINFVSITFVIILVIPLLAGLIRGITTKAIVGSMLSLIKVIEVIFFVFISDYLTKNIFFNEESSVYKLINPWIPAALKEAALAQDIIAYAVVITVVLIIFMVINSVVLTKLYLKIFSYIAQGLQKFLNVLPGLLKHVLGMVWNIPKAIILVILFGIAIKVFAFFSQNSDLNGVLEKSKGYEKVCEYAIRPVLDSKIGQDIPLILNKISVLERGVIPAPPEFLNIDDSKLSPNIKIIHYFNGVTLDEAVKSDEKIDSFARELVKGKTSSKDKARAIYKWITANIKYDEEKAKNITSNSSKAYHSGAKEAFYTKKGICFDYASLYVVMCRANNIKSALVTGLGYNGKAWGEHAWNKFFCPEENRWINVDSTFGRVYNCFDNKDFYSDHKYEKVRGEWN